MKKMIISTIFALSLGAIAPMIQAQMSVEVCTQIHQDLVNARDAYFAALDNNESAERINELEARYRVLRQQWSDARDNCPTLGRETGSYFHT